MPMHAFPCAMVITKHSSGSASQDLFPSGLQKSERPIARKNETIVHALFEWFHYLRMRSRLNIGQIINLSEVYAPTPMNIVQGHIVFPSRALSGTRVTGV